MRSALIRAALATFAASLLSCAGCSRRDGGTSPPPIEPEVRNIVYIDSVSASPGEKVKLNVNAVTESAIQGVDIPLKVSGTGFQIDSVSFVNTMLSGKALTEQITIDSSAKTTRVLKAYKHSEFIEPDSSLLMTLYVSIESSAEAQVIRIDTTTTVLPNGASASFIFSDTTSVPYPNTIVPEFTPGVISVSE